MSAHEVEVPEGYLHASEVLARGWSKALVVDVLNVHAERLEGPLPAEVSPKIFPLAEVEAAEAEYADSLAQARVAADAAAEEKRLAAEAQAAALAVQMPRLDRDAYTWDNTVGRALLKSRGWTDGHIDRLLGAPDYSMPGTYGPQYLWGRERVELAEATDEKLRKRMTSYREKKAAEKATRITSAVETGKVLFRKQGETWVLQGRGLAAGDTVTVTKRDGTTVEKRVARVLSTDAAGVVTAVPVDERAEQRARQRAQEQAERQADRQKVAAHRAQESAAEQQRVREARPSGSPALPYGARRNERADGCASCRTEVPAGEGHLFSTMGLLYPHDDPTYVLDGERSVWRVTCGGCTWRSTYSMPKGADPMPWVGLGWKADDVRLAHGAGLSADEVRGVDPADPETRRAWETLRAMQ